MGISMIRKPISIFAGTTIIVFIAASLPLLSLTKMGIDQLIVCSFDNKSSYIPNEVCHYYMVNYRISEIDINEIESGPGLDFILNAENHEKYNLASLFIERGLDVNSVNNLVEPKLTSLQSAVLSNDLEKVEFLIQEGVDINFSAGNMLPPLKLAEKIHKTEDRSKIIQKLSEAKSS